jgi:hypothetical protein
MVLKQLLAKTKKLFLNETAQTKNSKPNINTYFIAKSLTRPSCPAAFKASL